MPKWDKDDKVFPMKISYAIRGKKRFGRVVIPKPVLRLLKFPEKLYFIIQDNEIILKREVS